ncbi:MAG: hypothetical protein Q7R86_02790 [bacterium]|nr:hypothetical protein [bacterium]
MNQESRTCSKCKAGFKITEDDFSFYEKMGTPAPILCPQCRFKRRAQFRNEFVFYNRSCDLCDQAIISMYNPHAPFRVYCPDCWHSDKWDPSSFGKTYNPTRSFFNQLKELLHVVPKISIYRSDVMISINSPYENFAGGNKDCYLVANSGPDNENCAYSRGMIKCREVFDGYYVDKSEQIYESVGVHRSKGVAWSQNIAECLDSSFLINCSGLQNCFGCVNLRHKKYHFLNEPLTKEEYQKRVSEITGGYDATQKFRKKIEEFSLKFPRRENNNLKSVDSSGDYIYESKNCRSSFELSYCENVSYSFSVKLAKDAYDILGHGRNSELLLETVAAGYSSRAIGCWWVENTQDVTYCFAVRNSQECFGCDGLKNAKFSILNKSYPEAEYRQIKSKIVNELREIGEYGLFFPPSLALFAYNETIAQDNLPLFKKEALKQGFRWEENLQMTRGKETMTSAKIPDHIKDVPDSITEEILVCIFCQRNYKITPAELQFYRRMILPVPRKCFYCRHRDRIKRRGPFKLYDRKCDNCKKDIKTNFAPDRPEIVYCETCYQQEVI